VAVTDTTGHGTDALLGQASDITKSVTLTQARFFMDG